jgi:hypothetical protein
MIPVGEPRRRWDAHPLKTPGATNGKISRDAGAVTLRLGSPADDPQLERLAMRGSSGPLRPPVLVAELDGAIVAAVSLSTGARLADPLRRTSGLVELLRVRACQLVTRDPAGVPPDADTRRETDVSGTR